VEQCTSLIGFRVVRLVYRVDLATVGFTSTATPALPAWFGPCLPPARCWRVATHSAPEPGCGCGYHAFLRLDDALNYCGLFGSLPRLLAQLQLFGVYEVHGATTFRHAGGVYEHVLLPPCACGALACGVRPFAAQVGSLESLEELLFGRSLAPACVRHRDHVSTEALSRLLPFRPVDPSAL
jgi:hypothetical protein